MHKRLLNRNVPHDGLAAKEPAWNRLKGVRVQNAIEIQEKDPPQRRAVAGDGSPVVLGALAVRGDVMLPAPVSPG